MKKQIVKYFNLFLSFFHKKSTSEQKSEKVAQLKIKIEEFPNEDMLTYHISDPLTDIEWSFESTKDLQYGGIHSLNFENVEVPQNLQYLAGILLTTVAGLKKVEFSKYEIQFEKSSVFDWQEMEEDILPILRKEIAKGRGMIIKERVKMGINEKGYAVHTSIPISLKK